MKIARRLRDFGDRWRFPFVTRARLEAREKEWEEASREWSADYTRLLDNMMDQTLLFGKNPNR